MFSKFRTKIVRMQYILLIFMFFLSLTIKLAPTLARRLLPFKTPMVDSYVVGVGLAVPPLTDKINDIWWAQPTLRRGTSQK